LVKSILYKLIAKNGFRNTIFEKNDKKKLHRIEQLHFAVLNKILL